jgi:hypothetical protein
MNFEVCVGTANFETEPIRGSVAGGKLPNRMNSSGPAVRRWIAEQNEFCGLPNICSHSELSSKAKMAARWRLEWQTIGPPYSGFIMLWLVREIGVSKSILLKPNQIDLQDL